MNSVLEVSFEVETTLSFTEEEVNFEAIHSSSLKPRTPNVYHLETLISTLWQLVGTLEGQYIQEVLEPDELGGSS